VGTEYRESKEMISERVFFSFYQGKKLRGKKLLPPKFQLKLQALFTSRKYKESNHNEKQSGNWQSYSNPRWKFYKKFTCQSHSKNSLGYISKIFRNKFAIFVCQHSKMIKRFY